jgi:hypothetical protein
LKPSFEVVESSDWENEVEEVSRKFPVAETERWTCGIETVKGDQFAAVARGHDDLVVLVDVVRLESSPELDGRAARR